MLMLDFLITKLELTLNENANFQARDETKGKRARRRISAPVLHTERQPVIRRYVSKKRLGQAADKTALFRERLKILFTRHPASKPVGVRVSHFRLKLISEHQD
jgi:hypothetical protein